MSTAKANSINNPIIVLIKPIWMCGLVIKILLLEATFLICLEMIDLKNNQKRGIVAFLSTVRGHLISNAIISSFQPEHLFHSAILYFSVVI